MICGIFAVDLNGGYAYNGKLPWNYLEDKKWFRKHTLNQVVVMGRKTAEAPDMLFPLPSRTNYIVSSKFQNVDICQYLLNLQQKHDTKNIFLIGGAELLIKANPVLDRFFLTTVIDHCVCDQFVIPKLLTKKMRRQFSKYKDGLLFEEYAKT